jgi:dihydropteroate synthase
MTVASSGSQAVAASTSVRGLPESGRCLVMGVLNVTPDSFSDGGQFFDAVGAVDRGLRMADEGADIIDVGGESTRPDAQRVSCEEELRRVLPVVGGLAACGLTVSIDTMRARVAAAALDAGAQMVNDVSGGLADPAMVRVVAPSEVPYVAMHWRAHSSHMRRHAVYGDVVTDVVEELGRRLEALVDAGLGQDQIILDPGIGFAKTAEHSWTLLANLDALHVLARPILVGASRKSFLEPALDAADGQRSPAARGDATLAVSALAAAAGAYCLRVHAVRRTVDAVRTAAAWRAARRTAEVRQTATGANEPGDPRRRHDSSPRERL